VRKVKVKAVSSDESGGGPHAVLDLLRGGDLIAKGDTLFADEEGKSAVARVIAEPDTLPSDVRDTELVRARYKLERLSTGIRVDDTLWVR
jgi:hypothetical protein